MSEAASDRRGTRPRARVRRDVRRTHEASDDDATAELERHEPGLGPVAASEEPDVLLDVPILKVDEITLEVDELRAHVMLQAEVSDLLKLNVGADVLLRGVSLGIKGVEAQALLKVRLDNVAAILDRVLRTVDRHPEILEQVTRGVGELARGAGQAVEEVGGSAGEAVEFVGKTTGKALGDTASEAGSGAGQALGRAGEGVVDAAEGVSEAAGGAAQGAVESAGKAAKGVAGTADRAPESDDEVAPGARATASGRRGTKGTAPRRGQTRRSRPVKRSQPEQRQYRRS
ncbi:MAG: hypothetical protein ACRDYU_09890 [Actinomycetes bacterium]